MAVAIVIAGALVLKPNLFDELGLFTSETKNRISAATFEPTSNFSRTTLQFQILSQQRIGSESISPRCGSAQAARDRPCLGQR